MFKKIIAFISFVVLFGSTTFANYNDDEMLEAANNLAERSVVKDNSATPSEYNLSDNVLRQEIGLIAMRIAGLQKKASCSWIFSDVTASSPNDWACIHLETLVENNLISKNSMFRPEDNITKAESLKMLIKAIGYDFEYDSSSSVLWQKQYVDFAVEHDIIESFNDYNVVATRGWVFTVAAHTIEVKELEDKKEDEKKYSDEAMNEIEGLLETFE